ncbi:MAG: hypothetical protein RBT25_08680 [Lentisphaeria bacterium]|nr:hypothetical protein [Lentisphaeria bacterium]
MSYKHFLLLLFCMFSLLGSAADYSFPEWLRLMSDRGSFSTRWHMLSSSKNPVSKTLELDFAPEELLEAAIEYEIQVAPYDPKLKHHINAADYVWPNLLLTLNGQTVLDEPAAKHIKKGRHVLALNPALLQKGDNLLQFKWAPMPPDKPENLRYGFIYFTRDQEGEVDKALHIRLLLRFKNSVN